MRKFYHAPQATTEVLEPVDILASSQEPLDPGGDDIEDEPVWP